MAGSTLDFIMRLFTQTELLLPIPDSILLVVGKLFILQKSSKLVGTYITVAITQAVFHSYLIILCGGCLCSCSPPTTHISSPMRTAPWLVRLSSLKNEKPYSFFLRQFSDFYNSQEQRRKIHSFFEKTRNALKKKLES